MIRIATILDINEIMNIVKETIIDMHRNNNHQWNDKYPLKEDFEKDIENKELYVIQEEGKVSGFVCINKDEPIEYKGINWSKDNEAYIIHRLAISDKFRGRGNAYKLMKFAEALAIENNINYLKTDTMFSNPKAQKLFEKCGYQYTGMIHFRQREEEFFCYEKIV
ncbi:GNAT family N-acetyltransferase [Clostridium algidicarnis]|uniref:GNAT family N-acetyltransferase n=1 Tax=Clostridium algidicarnis TaxID=37659 RepID=UPI001CF50EE8|nr:GNAT family N-acetyltransferase [Clostridium algidicarnis]MCB2287003.1 GNAT family N-acetyltransferase [Clostridium algidicarnis]